mmetsp:Transcript_18162/g.45572  ORF Transcript_18162/g.45572 Transcript_18162/m.45572 type:complete len:285 (-) Transcript_18162:1339-2193(-)
MGALHSAPAPIQITVTVPSKGNKILKSKFFKEPPTEQQSVGRFFEERVRPILARDGIKFGDLLRTGVIVRGGQEEVEVDDSNDDATMYLQLGLAKVIFYVEQSGDVLSATKQPAQSIDDVLIREPAVQLPTWFHAGRPALTTLFRDLRQHLERDRLGFKGSADLKKGADWMLGLVELLYKISPFHGKCKARGHPVPKRFSFSDGADDYRKKGRSAPLLTQSFLEQVSSKLQSLILYPHVDQDEWVAWKRDAQRVLVRAVESPQGRELRRSPCRESTHIVQHFQV